jgi:hypothetical protein
MNFFRKSLVMIRPAWYKYIIFSNLLGDPKSYRVAIPKNPTR